MHPPVKQEDQIFKKLSDDAEYEFHQMRKDELKKLHENYIKSIGGGEGVVLEKEEKVYRRKTGTSKSVSKRAKASSKKIKTRSTDEYESDVQYEYDNEVIY